ncbi:hypothetical protein CH75_24025 [Dyella jiangningensis]|nr:hypothetical protein CH75_00945 [Dyella jiangningensis]AHX15961.1 hypothetical protein CH75_24025 [Dyella jiangningensis]
MRLVVTDANIIIDLAAGDMLAEMFRLPEVEFCVPDVLYLEELAENFGLLPGLGLRVLAQPPEAVEYVEACVVRYRRVSFNDLFALALARSLGCVLLSGDGALRDVAQIEQVEIRGTLWLIDLMLEAGLVTLERVTAAYEAMRRDGSRLPWNDVEAQLRRWHSLP